MNSKHKKTLENLYRNPIPKNIEWIKIESLLIALSCDIIEGHGSRVAFKKDDLRADFHRPHPGKKAKVYPIKAVREFLERLEIEI